MQKLQILWVLLDQRFDDFEEIIFGSHEQTFISPTTGKFRSLSLREPGAITPHEQIGTLHFTDYADQYNHLVLNLSQYTGDGYIGSCIVLISSIFLV